MDKKKLAAAMSAVFTYIKTSEEAAAFHAAGDLESVDKVGSHWNKMVQPVNFWGISGRQTQMQANTMIQLRMCK